MRTSSLLWRLVGVGVLLSLLVAPGSLAAPAQVDPHDKIDPQVLAATAHGATTEFLVVMAEQADVSAAYSLPTKQAKGRYVFDTLYAHAQRSQAGIRAYLDGQGVSYRSFYIINMLKVSGGQELVLALAARPDVGRIDANPAVRMELPKPEGSGLPGPDTVEWNINKINAPAVWALGFTGQGAVVADADVGVQWDHPALKDHYRGWDGTTANHNYNWWDTVDHTTTPIDPDGHGTHTTGTMVGDDASHTNQIGVAPGAKWIGCRNMDATGTGTPARYIECIEFTIAPWDLNQQNPRPDLAPDAVNNSWHCPTSEGCTDPNVLLTPIINLRAAGIVYAAAAQNGGPACSTISNPPGIYDPATTVGSTTSGDVLSSFSSKGPVTRDGSNRLKPDISAPGSSVRSSYAGNSYATLSGTSMATPHVAGAVALLWSARPWLQGNVDATEIVLGQGAYRNLGAPTPPTTCGNTPYNVYPNNIYGWGRLDILQTVNITPIQPTAVELAQFSGGSQPAWPLPIAAIGLIALAAVGLLGGALVLRRRTL